MFTTIGRLIKTTLQRIIRNPYHAIAAVFVLFMSFFVAAAFALILLNSNIILRYFESKPQVTAFFKNDTTVEQVNELKKVLADTGYLSSAKYVSKEEALKIYKEQNKKEPILLEMVTADMLPASLEVSATDIKYLPNLADILSKEKIVEEVIYQKEIVETLTTWTNNIRNIGMGIVAFLMITSLLITLVVIGLNISVHKDEIEIMRLVGASSSYIRIPFIFEGVIYGVVGSGLAVSVIWASLIYLSPVIAQFFAGIPLLPVSAKTMLTLAGAEALVGIILGFVSAIIATWKYLKV
ncbi:MAG: ABC transporter permease [Patescibacteria group bacterium]|nr:ABC transporter permease [Patescibacteria group bacterium]